MLKKINKILVNYVSIVLILLSLFLPLLYLYSPNGAVEFTSTNLFGFHLLTGYSTKNDGVFSQVIVSSYKAMLLFLLPVSIIVIDKVVKQDLGKQLFNFILSGISFVYFLLLSMKASEYLNQTYYGLLDFKSLAGLYIVIVCYFVYFLLFAIILFTNIKKNSNELKEKTALKNDEIKEVNNY